MMAPNFKIHHSLVRDELDEQRSNVRWAVDRFLFVFKLQRIISIIQLVFCVLAIVVFSLSPRRLVIRDNGEIYSERPGLEKAMSNGVGAAVTLLISLAVLQAVKRTHASRTSFFRLQRKHYSELRDEANVENIVAKLTNAFGLHGLRVWLDPRNFARTAYVAESDDETQVVLASGLCVLADQDYGAAEAIVAHELSHVRSNDWFWFDAEALASSVKAVLTPLLWIEILLGSFMLFVVFGSANGAVMEAFIACVIFGAFWLGPPIAGLIRLRRVSSTALEGIRLVELGADIGALECVKPDAVLRVFELEKGHNHDENHPSWEERIRNVLYVKKHFEAQCGHLLNVTKADESTVELLEDPEINSVRSGARTQDK